MRLARREVGGQCRLAQFGEQLAHQFHLARAGGEHPVSERATIGGIRRRLHPPIASQRVDVDGGHRVAQHGHVVVVQVWCGVGVETHRRRESPVELAVAHALADRRDGGLVPSHPEMTPRWNHVDGFDLGGGGQHEVGEAGGVGDELLVHHREQVVACQTPSHSFGIGHRHEWVATDHEQGAHRLGGVGVEELGHAHHRQLATLIGRRRMHHRHPVDELVAPGADAAGVSATAVAPRADQGGQTGEGAKEHRAVLVVLGSDERADRGRTDRAVHRREALDVGGGHPARGLGAFGSPLGHVRGELVETHRVCLHPAVVDEVIADEDVHHRQHQRDVGTGQRLHEPVGAVGRDRADGIDHHHLGAVGTCRFDDRPEVPVRQAGVGAPQQDES